MAVCKKVKQPRNAKLSYFVLSLGIGIGLFSLYWAWSTSREGPPLLEKEKLCSVTSRIKEIRRSKGNLRMDPEKKVIDDLIQIVPPAKFVCPYGFLNLFSTLCHWPNLNGVCEKTEKDVARTLLVLVSSARSNFVLRESIRRTWGSLWEYEGWQIRVIFFVGQSEFCLNHIDNNTEAGERKDEQEAAATEDRRLKEEAERYGDIVFGVFTDTYRNLTYKTLTSYKFLLDHCPDADLMLKMDDDKIPDIPKILDRRNVDLEPIKRNLSTNIPDIYCYFLPRANVQRALGKYDVSEDEYPLNIYPPYCVGGGVAITVSWIRKIYSVRQLKRFFWIEDVFVTGMLRLAAEKIFNNSTSEVSNGPAQIFNLGRMMEIKDQEMDYFRNVCKTVDLSLTGRGIGWILKIRTETPEYANDFFCVWGRILKRTKKKSANFTIRRRRMSFD